MVDESHQQARVCMAVALWLGAGCGPGAVGGSSTGAGTASGTESGTEEGTSETGEPEFPELPEPEPGCLERGSAHALIGAPQVIVSDHREPIGVGDLVATSQGMLAFFLMSPPEDLEAIRIGWVGRLDEYGTPIDEPFVMFERGLVNGPRAHVFGDDLMVTFTGLWGYEDRAAAVAVDALGVPLAEELARQPDDRSCCVFPHSPEGAWTGHRHLFSWRDNSSDPLPGRELLMEAFRSDGSSSGWVQLQDDGDYFPGPRFVVTSEAAFLISSAGEDGVMLHRFDVSGNWLQDHAVTLELPADFSVGEAGLAANAEGIVIWLDERDMPHRVLRWRLDPQGELLEGPIEVPPPGPDIVDADFELVAAPGGFALAASRRYPQHGSIVVMTLDSTGTPTETLEIEPEPERILRKPSLAVRGDSIFVLYEAQHGSDPLDLTFDLLVSHVRCVDP